MRTVIFGLPKSGTTYLFSLLAEALSHKNRTVDVFEPNNCDEQRELHRNDGRSWAETENMLVKILYSHPSDQLDKAPAGWYGEDAQRIFAHYDRKIFLVRDPRDICISEFFYQWYYEHSPDPKSFDRAYQLVQKKEANPSDIPFYKIFLEFEDPNKWAFEYKKHLSVLSKFITELSRHGWFILRYKDLVDGRLNSLEEYMGISLTGEHKIRPGLKRVSRSNTYGNWRQWFTSKDVQFFRPVFQDFLENQNYPANDWELEEVDTLPSEQGSAYMYRLFHHRDLTSNTKPRSFRQGMRKKLRRVIAMFR